MFRVTLTQADVTNLAIFLERITLKGNEVTAFNNVINALNKAEKVEPPKSVDEMVDDLKKAVEENL